MAIVGNTKQWRLLFPQRLVPRVLDLIVNCWEHFSKPTSGESEPQISRRFLAALKNDRNIRKLPFNIFRETVEDNADGTKELGRIDLRFMARNQSEEIYLAFECKKLNVRYGKSVHTLATDYVDDGLRRFFNGQYAGGCEGGMIAYVMDACLNNAIQAVQKVIGDRTTELELVPPPVLAKSSVRPKCDTIRETSHRSGHFRVHHIFLPV